ncbi:MAG TPA: DUF3344 domain-containing protein [Methanoregulaceae archaeon]|nr:DUF3344 domain-containing protein [Methanoregulaceae archaeon]HQJ88354.1 DUF3344 domain-containing protein [Methanoregulaceae archaeon]
MTGDRRRWMLLLAVVASLLISVVPVSADYTGGTIAIAGQGTVQGDLVLTHGDSRYSGEVPPGGTYSVTFPVSLPAGATRVRNATVYLSWTWSHSGTTGATPSLRTEVGGAVLEPVRRYEDRKGHPPYDYPSGLYVYDLGTGVQAGTPLTLTVTNTATDAGVSFNGAVLVTLCEGGTDPVSYWIAEGAEMVYATEGVTPGAATARIVIPDLPPVPAGARATLLSVVPSGNKGKNVLSVNGRELPGLFDGRPYPDLAINTTEVGPLLVPGSNTFALRDDGDYMVPGLFVLTIRSGPGAAPAATTQRSPAGVTLAIGALGVAAVAARAVRPR